MSTVLPSDKPRASRSPLLGKARRLGLSLPVDLERLAILRGCDYYDRELPARDQALGKVALSNAELAIALVTPSLDPTAREIRLAAALLGSPNLDPDEITGLEIVRYLILYGRSAIWLGFENPPPAAATTQDVDAIIPDDQVQALADDLRFWDARDAVNERFKSEGLCITHLFPEKEVFLRREWAGPYRCDHAPAIESSQIVSSRDD